MKRPLWALATIGAGLTLVSAAGAGYAGQESSAALLPRFKTSGEFGFGSSVAISRNGLTLTVGEPEYDKGRGAVSVYSRAVGGTWTRRARLSPAQKGDGLGTSIAISADGRVVLAGVNRGKGAAWIFRSAGGGTWIGQKLTPRDPKGQSSFFGYSLALSESGSTALIGGPGDAGFRGAAWVFTRQGTTWKQQGSKLVGKGEVGADRFGWSVALTGDGSQALVGGPRDRDSVGAAWSFSRSGSNWRQSGNKLMTPSVLGRRRFEFGWDVALSGDGRLALIGAPRLQRSNVRGHDGAVFMFARTESGWARRPRLESGYNERFGAVVDMSPNGTAAVVGTSSVLLGRVVAYSCSTLGCALTGQILLPPRDDFDDPIDDVAKRYGADVAVANDADAVVVGAPGEPAKKKSERAFGQVWTFLPWPAVTGRTPSSGPSAGGTEVAITGENFVKVRRVLFGSTPAASFVVQSPTRMTAVSPPGEGTVHLKVETAVGTSPQTGGWFEASTTQFFYYPRPVVSSISPTSGPTAGGTAVTITGTGFNGPTVRFGEREATVTQNTGTVMTVLTPTTGSAGTVDVTVTTAGGTSETNSATKYTYIAPVVEQAIRFDNLVTGGPGGGGGALVQVTNQYAGQGVTFNSPSAIDYSKGSAIPGFARSGTVAIEHCVGVEFCTTPIRATFSAPQRLVRVYVGFSFQLNQPLQVQLRALNAQLAVVGTATATLPARATPTPIGVPLEVSVGIPAITQIEVLVPGGYNSALAVDDVTFQS